MGLSVYPEALNMETMCIIFVLKIETLVSLFKETLLSKLRFHDRMNITSENTMSSNSSTDDSPRVTGRRSYENSDDSLTVAGRSHYENPDDSLTVTSRSSHYEYSDDSMSLVKKFQSRNPMIPYNKTSCMNQGECPICLVEFGEHAYVHHLYCGHVFHAPCLYTCLRYSYLTCPLCRAVLIQPPQEEQGSTS